VPGGAAFTTEIPQGNFDAIVLGVKPQKLAEVAAELEPLAGPATVVVSMLAAVDLAALAGRFPRAGGLVRLMPNLAVAIGKSPNALVGQGLSEDQKAAVSDLATRLGSAEWLADETQFDLITALTGSGPGFVYRFIDALAGGAAELGMDRAQADRLAKQMVAGAAALAADSPHSPGELARRVASPGGTTQKGLDVLDDDEALQVLLTRCLRATRDRERELARALSA
jgi:pyrroline-5-carboxylate reductase